MLLLLLFHIFVIVVSKLLLCLLGLITEYFIIILSILFYYPSLLVCRGICLLLLCIFHTILGLLSSLRAICLAQSILLTLLLEIIILQVLLTSCVLSGHPNSWTGWSFIHVCWCTNWSVNAALRATLIRNLAACWLLLLNLSILHLFLVILRNLLPTIIYSIVIT